MTADKGVRGGGAVMACRDGGQLSVGTVVFDSLIFKPNPEAQRDTSSRKTQMVKIRG